MKRDMACTVIASADQRDVGLKSLLVTKIKWKGMEIFSRAWSRMTHARSLLLSDFADNGLKSLFANANPDGIVMTIPSFRDL